MVGDIYSLDRHGTETGRVVSRTDRRHSSRLKSSSSSHRAVRVSSKLDGQTYSKVRSPPTDKWDTDDPTKAALAGDSCRGGIRRKIAASLPRRNQGPHRPDGLVRTHAIARPSGRTLAPHSHSFILTLISFFPLLVRSSLLCLPPWKPCPPVESEKKKTRVVKMTADGKATPAASTATAGPSPLPTSVTAAGNVPQRQSQDVRQDASSVASSKHGSDGEDDQPPLPFSKARCIALVATVTGAAFLNVSALALLPSCERSEEAPPAGAAGDIFRVNEADLVYRRCLYNPSSSSCRRLGGTWTFPRADSSGSCRHTPWPLVASCLSGAALPISMASGPSSLAVLSGSRL